MPESRLVATSNTGSNEMTEDQKESFMKHVRNLFDNRDAEDIEWFAFVMKTNTGRIALASENAPKSTRLCG